MTLFVTVLGASLVGSLHCAGMCGPLVLLYAGDSRKNHVSHLLYNGGRLVAYATLGALAGALGGLIDLGGTLMGVAELAAILAAAFIAIYGAVRVAELLGRRLPEGPIARGLKRLSLTVSQRILRLPVSVRAAGLGLASALLPCGWLYAFVAVAAGTGSAALGAFTMVGFWLGTVPALAAIGLGAGRMFGPLRAKAPLIAALALVLVGLASVGMRAGKLERFDGWVAKTSAESAPFDPIHSTESVRPEASRSDDSKGESTETEIPTDAPCH